MMVEKIENNGKLYAIIVRRTYWEKGVNFVTPPESSLQFGVHVQEGGHIYPPHLHNNAKRELVGAHEIIHVDMGEILVDFYDENKIKLGSALLGYGDTAIQFMGGHGIWALRFSKFNEIKLGPYNGKSEDKEMIE